MSDENCPFVTLADREDGDFDVVRCDRPYGHDDSHHTDDQRVVLGWVGRWAYDPERGVDES